MADDKDGRVHQSAGKPELEYCLGLNYFPAQPISSLEVTEALFEATYDKPGIQYYGTVFKECYDGTEVSDLYIALSSDGRAWGTMDSFALTFVSGVVEVRATDLQEATDKIAEIFDLDNFDIFDPGTARTSDGLA